VSTFSAPAFGDDAPEEAKVAGIRQLFSRLMHADAGEVSRQVGLLMERIAPPPCPTRPGLTRQRTADLAEDPIVDITDVEAFMRRLCADFPGDVGVLCPLILNCVYLAPGQSFLMGPNEPHAYVSGDCIECMAPSDNVVRSGLTPKFKDVDVLCDMLTYRTGKLGSAVAPMEVDEYTVMYRPPIEIAPEFEVSKSSIPSGASIEIPVCGTASVVLVTSGVCNISVINQSGEPLGAPELCEQVEGATGGSVLFLSAQYAYRISATESVELYRSSINRSE
jgi:mannose-6-phosphate isomerase